VTERRSATKEFKVRIDVELPPEAHERIERAIQRAVLHELAETDVADGFSVQMRLPAEGSGGEEAADQGLDGPDLGSFGGPVLDGIWIRDEQTAVL